jgi:hypothetical protein
LIFAGVMIVGHRANRMLLLQSVQLGQRNNELMAEILDANQTLENKVRERTETLEHQASHDLLTGLFNRRGLTEQFERIAEDEPMRAYFLDLNRFKRINDTLGHEAGDYVLREVATRLMTRLPKEAIDAKAAMRDLPPMIKGYLRLGGVIGDGAVIDYEFNTVDVLVYVDMLRVTEKYRRHYTRDMRAEA